MSSFFLFLNDLLNLVFWVFVFVCWQYADGCRAIPWSTGSIHLKETISSFSSCQLSIGPQLEVGVCEPFPLHVGMLTYLILYSSCIGLHSCYEVLSNFELVLSCSEDNLTAVFSTSGPGPLNEESVVWIRYLIFFWPCTFQSTLMVSVLTTIHCTKKLLWWGLRALIIYV